MTPERYFKILPEFQLKVWNLLKSEAPVLIGKDIDAERPDLIDKSLARTCTWQTILTEAVKKTAA